MICFPCLGSVRKVTTLSIFKIYAIWFWVPSKPILLWGSLSNDYWEPKKSKHFDELLQFVLFFFQYIYAVSCWETINFSSCPSTGPWQKATGLQPSQDNSCGRWCSFLPCLVGKTASFILFFHRYWYGNCWGWQRPVVWCKGVC